MTFIEMSKWATCALLLLIAACREPMSPPQGQTPKSNLDAPTALPSTGDVATPKTLQSEGAAKVTGAKAVQKAGSLPPHALRMTEANTLYGQRCALCHGAKGLGDGVAAVNLRPQPRSFAVQKWQEETSDEAIMEIIVKGGAAVGRSMMMPPARDLAGQTELLHALVAVVRNFGPGGAKGSP